MESAFGVLTLPPSPTPLKGCPPHVLHQRHQQEVTVDGGKPKPEPLLEVTTELNLDAYARLGMTPPHQPSGLGHKPRISTISIADTGAQMDLRSPSLAGKLVVNARTPRGAYLHPNTTNHAPAMKTDTSRCHPRPASWPSAWPFCKPTCEGGPRMNSIRSDTHLPQHKDNCGMGPDKTNRPRHCRPFPWRRQGPQ